MRVELPAVTATVGEVWVTGGTGRGETPLVAFDAALADAGIHNANLIRVSSITPDGVTRHDGEPAAALAQRITPGAFIPAVYAHAESGLPGEQVYAAVAGMTLEDGYGINVEDAGVGDDRDAVRDRCTAMLEEMASTRDRTPTADIWLRYESAQVPPEGTVTSAVAALLYGSLSRGDTRYAD